MYYDPSFEEQQTQIEEWRLLLSRAADYLDEHGWCVRTMENEQHQVCVRGALACVELGMDTFTLPPFPLSSERLFRAIEVLNRRFGMTISTWNDEVCKSKEEAVAALRAAAKD